MCIGATAGSGNRTVLTQGDYGPPGTNPRSVEVVGSIRSADRTVNYRGQSISVVPFEVGGILVYARDLSPRRLGGFDQCPIGTAQSSRALLQSSTSPRRRS